MRQQPNPTRPPTTRARIAWAVAVCVAVMVPITAVASHSFSDVPDSHIFHDDIEWLKDSDVTRGCNPGEGNTRFCPEDPVTRGQMSAFMRRLAENRVVDAGTVDGLDSTSFVGRDEPDAVTASMIADEPGIGNELRNLLVITSLPQRVLSVQLSVPGGGYVVLQASGYFEFSHQEGSGADQGVAWIDTSAAADTDFEELLALTTGRIASDDGSGTHFVPWSLLGIDEVANAGEVTYYLEAWAPASSGGQTEILGNTLVATFFPTAYGPTTELIPAGGIDPSSLSPPPPGS